MPAVAVCDKKLYYIISVLFLIKIKNKIIVTSERDILVPILACIIGNDFVWSLKDNVIKNNIY